MASESIPPMEFAVFSMPFGDMPRNDAFQKLGDSQCVKVHATAEFLYIVVGVGQQFKFRRIEAGMFAPMHVYKCSTEAGADWFGSWHIIIRNVVAKYIQFCQQELIPDPRGNFKLDCLSSMSGNVLCTVVAKLNSTVGYLKQQITQELTETRQMSSSMQVTFTDDFMMNARSNVKVKTAFKTLLPKVNGKNDGKLKSDHKVIKRETQK